MIEYWHSIHRESSRIGEWLPFTRRTPLAATRWLGTTRLLEPPYYKNHGLFATFYEGSKSRKMFKFTYWWKIYDYLKKIKINPYFENLNSGTPMLANRKTAIITVFKIRHSTLSYFFFQEILSQDKEGRNKKQNLYY